MRLAAADRGTSVEAVGIRLLAAAVDSILPAAAV
jgi:hypothetical protein